MRIQVIIAMVAIVFAGMGLADAHRLPPFLIVGEVQYDDGRPVAEARVIAENGAGVAGRLPLAESGADGRFEIRVWQTGSYRVYASKESEMYPDCSWSLYAGERDTAPEAVVTDADAVDVGVVALGRRGARVYGCVVDANTREPVRNVQVVVRAGHNPDVYISSGAEASGCFTLLVPAAAVGLEISAPGYETWRYGSRGVEKQTEMLELASGTSLPVTIELSASASRAKP